MRFLSLSLCLGLVAYPALFAFAGAPEILITLADGRKIVLEPEDTSGIAARPLVETRDRLSRRFKKDILFLYKMRVEEGVSIIGRHKIGQGPARLTAYEITKARNSNRQLRVAGSQFRRLGETAEFKTVVNKFDEHLYLITAESVTSQGQLNPHLQYMNSQKNEIILKGFSTNWNFSSLRLQFLEKGGAAREGEFSKDADFLVNQLIDPQWIVAIRLEYLGK
jgi:hypothetical protein